MALDEADRVWLVPLILTGIAVHAMYVAANPYPAHGAGLYTIIGEEIIAHGYGLPERIPHYSADGVPFAYPPLAFYGIAIGLDLGVDLFTLARIAPGLVTVLYLVPTFLLGRELLTSRALAAAATTLVAVNPQLLEWHISAGGMVRAPAFLFALSGTYAGYRLFTGGGPRWVAAAVGLFGLTVLTHPTYSMFFAVSFVVFWFVLDRSPLGFGRGLLVGMGGVMLAAPWWLTVLATHGTRVFVAAAGTHGGIGGGVAALVGGELSPWLPILVGLTLILFARGTVLLPSWLLATAAVFEQPRFSYLIGSFVLVAVAAPAVEPRLAIAADRLAVPRRRAAVLLIVVGAVVGIGYLGHDMTIGRDEWTPEFVDDDDIVAMKWAASETHPDATFVVLGDAAEWFPAVAHRTILVAPWGVEWESAATFARHLAVYENVSDCETAQCVESGLGTLDADPDYLYVPHGAYTVRGSPRQQGSKLPAALARSPHYTRVYANGGVAIFRVNRDGAASSRE